MEPLTPQVMHKLVFTVLVHGLPDAQTGIALDVLTEALGNPNAQVRELAVVALAELPVSPAKRVAALSRALRDSGAASARMSRRTFHRWLIDAARDFNLTARGPRGGAVHVLDVRELGDRAFEHVCIGGLTDGRFPGRDTPHPLFPDEDRIRVNAWHKRDVFRVGTGEARHE